MPKEIEKETCALCACDRVFVLLIQSKKKNCNAMLCYIQFEYQPILFTSNACRYTNNLIRQNVRADLILFPLALAAFLPRVFLFVAFAQFSLSRALSLFLRFQSASVFLLCFFFLFILFIEVSSPLFFSNRKRNPLNILGYLCQSMHSIY